MANPKKTYWFIFSYDATKEIYETVAGEYKPNDFRKYLIRILRIKKVVEMFEFVESTIHFKDPSTDTDVVEKINYWEKVLKDISPDFNFIICPIIEYKNGDIEFPLIRDRRKVKLNDSFQGLLKEVLEEEKTKTVPKN